MSYYEYERNRLRQEYISHVHRIEAKAKRMSSLATTAYLKGIQAPRNPASISAWRNQYNQWRDEVSQISRVRMGALYPKGYKDVSLMDAWTRLEGSHPDIARKLEEGIKWEEYISERSKALNSFLIHAGKEGYETQAQAAWFNFRMDFPDLFERKEEKVEKPEVEYQEPVGPPSELPKEQPLWPEQKQAAITPGLYEIELDGTPAEAEIKEDLSVWRGEEQIGVLDPATNEIKPVGETPEEPVEEEKFEAQALPSEFQALPTEVQQKFIAQISKTEAPSVGETGLQFLELLGYPIAWAAQQGGQILTAPIRPSPTEPLWRPPTEEEKTKGIYAFQPTEADKKAYEEWADPGWEIPFLPLFHLPWTPPEMRDKKWKLGVKGLAEEFTILPLWFAGGIGTKNTANLFRQAQKIQAKQVAGKSITTSEKKILERAIEQETKISQKIADTAPDLVKVERMWSAEAKKTIPTFDESAWSFWRRVEEKITDKFAGINKLTSKAKAQWRKSHPTQPFPLALDAELHAANLGGAADAGIQRAMDAFQRMRQTLGNDVSINYVDNYLHLKHNLDVLAMHPARKVAGGLEGAEGINKALLQMKDLLGAEQFTKVENAAGQIVNHYRTYLQRSVDSGLVSQEMADVLVSKYPNYNPIAYLQRIADQTEGKVGKGLSVTKNDIRELSELGSEAARERPLNTLARLSIEKETLIRRNEAAKAIRDLIKGDEQLQRQIARLRPNERGMLSYMENGERHTVTVPKWLQTEATLLGQLGFKDLEKFAAALNAASRFGMTTANLAFFVPNMAVDSLTAMITYGVGPARLGKRLLLNLKDIIKEDKVLASLRREGGSMSGFWGKTPEDIAKEATKQGILVLRNKWNWKRVLGLPFEAITKIGHAVEMTPRSAVFELELKRGKLLDYAALAARRSTIDFQRSGTAIRQANSLFLYLNAGVQGSLIPFRALRDLPRSRIWLAGYMGLITANYAWNRQFPEYEDIPDYYKYGALPVMLPSQEYDKRGNKVPHFILVVPNLREWALFSGPLTYAMRKLDKKSSDDFGQFLQAWVPPLNPVSQIVGEGGMPVPTQIGQVITELALNRDTFRGRDIVPEEYINLPPAEQYNEWTTITARTIGQTIGYSPMKLDFLVKGILGGLGNQLLSAMDSVIKKIQGEGGDERIQLLLGQLQGIQSTSDPDKIPALRKDFLQSLTPEDREAVLKLEIKPKDRIPIISDIFNRIYRERGGQIFLTAKANAKKALDNDKSFETAQDELNKNAEQNALNFMNGSIPAQTYVELLSDYRMYYHGRMAEAWRLREMAGAIATADVQPYLPEEYKWKPEELALHQYQMLVDQLYDQLAGVETDENVSLLWDNVDAFINAMEPDLKDYILKHKYDWINDLPPEAQKVERMHKEDMDYASQSGYWDLPTQQEQREKGIYKPPDLRALARQNDAKLDAILIFWFDFYSSLKSNEAYRILLEKAAYLGRPLSAIPGSARVLPIS